MTNEDWRHRAACRGYDPEIWQPVSETGPALSQIAEAKAICATCPVADFCLQWALEFGEPAGIWGGLTEDERRTLKCSQVPA